MVQGGKVEDVLVMDTCGERGSVALFQTGALRARRTLPERTASAALLQAIRQVLDESGLSLDELDGIGVVNGPGSFTGLRVGLAITKGLAEATALPVAPVSRLAVLARAGHLQRGVAVLRAGRDELYMREQQSDGSVTERLVGAEALRLCLRPGDEVVYAEEAVLPLLPAEAPLRRVELNAEAAFPLVLELLRAGGADLAGLDGNYVRNESAIYARRPAL